MSIVAKKPKAVSRPMNFYKSYSFIDKDPMIEEVRTVIDKTRSTHAQIERDSGVTSQTLRNWFDGPTRRPQAATVRAVLRSMGYDLGVVRLRK